MNIFFYTSRSRPKLVRLYRKEGLRVLHLHYSVARVHSSEKHYDAKESTLLHPLMIGCPSAVAKKKAD